jgi:hypothetical protein
MNDTDQEVRAVLRKLIDPEPVDTDRVLHTIHASQRTHHALRRLTAFGMVAAVALVALLLTTSRQEALSFHLIGAAGADVVVRVESRAGEAPNAELTVGDRTVPGIELQGTPVPGGLRFDPPMPKPDPSVDVPDGSSLRVEGDFDTASASSSVWVLTGPDGMESLNTGTWQLDSSGGSVVFRGPGDVVYLVVHADWGADGHDFLFPIQVVPIGS